MSLKSDEESPIKPRELVFLLAIAGRIDAQSRLLAHKLDEERYIYHAYAVLDSLSSSGSMFKYIFEVFISNTNDANLMHQIMTSPEGIAAITGEALFLVTFSFLASYFDNKDAKKDPLKRFIVAAWPYFRDVMKGMKNAYKGWKSAVQIMATLSGVDLKFMMIPLGLVLGIISAANRVWIRFMDDNREEMKRANKALLTGIQKLSSLTKKEREDYLKDSNRIQYQSDHDRVYAFLAMGLGGLIDSLYLYAGLISLAVLAPPAFLAMSVITIFYSVICVISRLYEEYDKQLQLIITQTRCQLTLVSKELETTYAVLLALQIKIDKTDENWAEIRRLKKEISGLIEHFDELHHLLKEQTTQTYTTAVLFGVKQGLFTYGVLASFLFMITSVFTLTTSVFPPALLMACIVSGLVAILAVTAYSVRCHYLHLQAQKSEEEKPYHQLIVMRNEINAEIDADVLAEKAFREALDDGANPEASPSFSFPNVLEVLRSIGSGVSKGNNFGNFVGTPWQDADPQSQGHDAPIMLLVTMASSALFAIVLALRALARGFRNAPLLPAPGSAAEDETGVQKTEAVAKSDKLVQEFPPKTRSLFDLWGFFTSAKKPPTSNSSDSLTSSKKPPTSNSSDSLTSSCESSLNKVQGLM